MRAQKGDHCMPSTVPCASHTKFHVILTKSISQTHGLGVITRPSSHSKRFKPTSVLLQFAENLLKHGAEKPWLTSFFLVVILLFPIVFYFNFKRIGITDGYWKEWYTWWYGDHLVPTTGKNKTPRESIAATIRGRIMKVLRAFLTWQALILRNLPDFYLSRTFFYWSPDTEIIKFTSVAS